jgi:ribosomal-protein-alanine N-acetyltransferase
MSDRYHVRWMIASDMLAVLSTESACFEFPWTEKDFIRCLRQRNCVGMVVEEIVGDDERGAVVGYMIYEIHPTRTHWLSFAVHPAWRGTGAGYAMLCKMRRALEYHAKRKRLTCEVRETNLPTQQWLRRQGFKAYGIAREFYSQTNEDAFLFVLDITADEHAVA